jgi:hypothetical protein
MCENALSLRDYKGKATSFKNKPSTEEKGIINTTAADTAENQIGYDGTKTVLLRALLRYKQEKPPLQPPQALA